MTVGARPWQILPDVPYPERYPEEYAPPFRVRVAFAGMNFSQAPADVYHVNINPIVDPGSPPPRQPIWNKLGPQLRPIAAAIAVDMASVFLTNPRHQQLIDELVNRILDQTVGEARHLQQQENLNAITQLHADIDWQLDLLQTPNEPADPVQQVLLAASNLAAVTGLNRKKSTQRTKRAVLWALRALGGVGSPSTSRPEPEANAIAVNVQRWLDLWWSETLEVIAWDRSKSPDYY